MTPARNLIASEPLEQPMDAERPKIRTVFDCMVFLQAAARRDSAAGVCLLLVELGAVELLLSGEIMTEIRDVLTRSSPVEISRLDGHSKCNPLAFKKCRACSLTRVIPRTSPTSI